MRNALKLSFILLLVFSVALAGCGAAQDDQQAEEGTNEGNTGANEGGNEGTNEGEATEPAEEKGEVVIGVTPWSTTVFPTQVVRLILEDMGYTVKLQDADVGIVYAGLGRGDIDVFMDSWLPDLHANYMKQHGDNIEDVAVSMPEASLGWLVPSYVEEVDSIADLNEHKDLFNGKITGIDEGAGMTATSREIIEGYNLDYEYVASSEAAMLAEAKRAIAQKKPILFLGYRPHSMFALFDLKILEDPKGYWKASEIHVLANKDFKNESPEAYQFLKNWSISIDEVEKAILAMDTEGADPAELAAQWIEENQDKVKEMTGK